MLHSSVLLHLCVFFSSVTSLVLATPVLPQHKDTLQSWGPAVNGFWANYCHYLTFLCPRGAITQGITVHTPLGDAYGVVNTSSVNRFVVKYASAQRWQPSTLVTTWQLPYVSLLTDVDPLHMVTSYRNGSTDAFALPPMCPQPFVSSSAISENCLSMVLYVPTSLTYQSPIPTLMW